MDKDSENNKERCPYLSIIDRSVLDFDHEKICSITLKEEHVYCCLICGINYQGKGKDSVAYKHSLQTDHHLFINLDNSRIYCLPNDYEVIEHSLEDIKGYLHPNFTPNSISTLFNTSKTFDGIQFLPGFIGLSNFGNNDSLNVILLLLSQISNFRNLCLEYHLYNQNIEDRIQDLFLFNIIEAIRKIYNPFNLKGKFSPYNLVSIIEKKSKGKFPFTKSNNSNSLNNNIIDPMALLSWIFFQLKKKIDKYLKHFQVKFIPNYENIPNMEKKSQLNIISSCIQGQLYFKTENSIENNNYVVESSSKKFKIDSIKKMKLKENNCIYFNCISLTLPSIIETTLGSSAISDFQDSKLIPQIPIYKLLDNKFFSSRSALIWKLPYYLIIHIGRFSRNTLDLEKNKILISFPLIDFDLSTYIHPDAIQLNPCTKYNLVVNISHKGSIKKGKFISQLLHPIKDEWIEIEDINVQTVLPQAILLNEAYLLLYKRSDL